jgi:hypothetical protein
MLKKLFSTLAVIILLSSQIYPQVIAKYAGEFMAIGIGGRPLGMGGAFTAIANDITSAYYNPAGLANLNYPQISLMHDERYGNLVNYDYAAFALPYKEDMTFAISITRLGVDGIPDTRNALVNRTTGEVIYDMYAAVPKMIDPSKVKEFNNQDWAFYLSYAKRHSDNFYYGANVKIIRRDIAEFGATGIGFDVGALYTPYKNLYFGANLQDITTTLVAWDHGYSELISPTAKLGTAYIIEALGGKIIPALDFDVRFENRQFASNFNLGPVSFDMHGGLEYTFKNLFSIRGGYNDVKQFTMGAGVRLPKLNIDYSFARFNMSKDDRLDDTHRISLILTLEETRFERKGITIN